MVGTCHPASRWFAPFIRTDVIFGKDQAWTLLLVLAEPEDTNLSSGRHSLSSTTNDIVPKHVRLDLQLSEPILDHVTDADDATELAV